MLSMVLETQRFEGKQRVGQSILWSEKQVAEALKDGRLEAETSDLGDALDVLIRFLDLPRTLGD